MPGGDGQGQSFCTRLVWILRAPRIARAQAQASSPLTTVARAVATMMRNTSKKHETASSLCVMDKLVSDKCKRYHRCQAQPRAHLIFTLRLLRILNHHIMSRPYSSAGRPSTSAATSNPPYLDPRYQYPETPTTASTSASDVQWAYGSQSRPYTGAGEDLYEEGEYVESDDEDVFAYLPPTTAEQGKLCDRCQD